jgi:hypothetical protein
MMINAQTACGRIDAQTKNIEFGREPKLTRPRQREARERISACETQCRIARSYDVSQSTISYLQEC